MTGDVAVLRLAICAGEPVTGVWLACAVDNLRSMQHRAVRAGQGAVRVWLPGVDRDSLFRIAARLGPHCTVDCAPRPGSGRDLLTLQALTEFP